MSTMTDRIGNQPAAQRQTTTPRGGAVPDRVTIGSYLATRLEQIGLKHHFAVAGDYNLALLDQLLLNKNLQQVYCCNELIANFDCYTEKALETAAPINPTRLPSREQ